MEEEQLSINIPKKEKYTLCILDSNGNPKNFIVFGGTSQPMNEDEILAKAIEIAAKKRKDWNGAMCPADILNVLMGFFRKASWEEVDQAAWTAYLSGINHDR